MNGMYEELLEKLRKNNRMSGWTHIDRLIDEAAEAIEALQQENEQLRAKLEDWKHEVKCLMDEVIAREKQIEQLRGRVARMRELLTKAYDEIEKYKCLWKGRKPSGCDCPKPTALQDEIEQTLAEIDYV